MLKQIRIPVLIVIFAILTAILAGCSAPETDNPGGAYPTEHFQTVAITQAPTAAPTRVPEATVNWDDMGETAQPQQGSATAKPSVTSTLKPIATDAPASTAKPTATIKPTATPKPTDKPSTTLKKGSSGSEVKTVQQLLKKLGYYSGSVDGKFGASTEKAVKAFQKRNGLTADGKVGEKTLAALKSSNAKKAAASATAKPTKKPTAKPTSTPKPTTKPNTNVFLTIGSNRTSDVKRLQNRLIELGWLAGKATGSYGQSTAYAVRAFQRATSGLYADGEAGSATLTKLYSSSARKCGTPVASVGVTLKVGSEGGAVRALQNRLKKLGYLKTVDGSFGDATQTAVMKFQKNNDLTINGIANAEVLAVLYSDSAK